MSDRQDSRAYFSGSGSNRLPQHRLEFRGVDIARVAQVDLVVFAAQGEVVCGQELLVHPRDHRRFVVVGADVQRLHAETLRKSFEPHMLQRRQLLLLCGRRARCASHAASPHS